MSTPIETNTEELQEILQTVYNLPLAGGSGDSYDLLLRMDAPKGTDIYSMTDFSQLTLSIVTGNISDVRSKLEAGKPVRVGASLFVYYWDLQLYGFAEASYITISATDHTNIEFILNKKSYKVQINYVGTISLTSVDDIC